jgi:membrane-associated protease RseP (regulator of RpoE activity)
MRKGTRIALPGLLIAACAVSAGAQDPLRRKGDLGITVRAPAASAKPGAEIARVRPGAAGERSGLAAGDRILAVDGRKLTDEATLSRVYERLRAGDRVRLTVARAAGEFDRTITVPALPLERIEGLEIVYGSVVSEKGHRVRTIRTRPEGATGRLPGLFLVGWLSCDSVESPLGEPDCCATS